MFLGFDSFKEVGVSRIGETIWGESNCTREESREVEKVENPDEVAMLNERCIKLEKELKSCKAEQENSLKIYKVYLNVQAEMYQELMEQKQKEINRLNFVLASMKLEYQQALAESSDKNRMLTILENGNIRLQAEIEKLKKEKSILENRLISNLNSDVSIIVEKEKVVTKRKRETHECEEIRECLDKLRRKIPESKNKREIQDAGVRTMILRPRSTTAAKNPRAQKKTRKETT
jgi:hypothetical protein